MQISTNWLALKADGLKGRVAVPVSTPNSRIKSQSSADRVLFANYVALDCEMVECASIEHMLARVSIVDFEGRVLYDAYVRPREKVVDFRTAITGITRETLSRRGESFKAVQARVLDILRDKVIVGHAVHHDFEALEMDRPIDALIRDTCLFPRLRPPNRKQTPSLRLLAEYWLDKVVQTGSHSSVEDARVAMTLYKRFRTEWEESFKQKK